jgi:hypothetical protein
LPFAGNVGDFRLKTVWFIAICRKYFLSVLNSESLLRKGPQRWIQDLGKEAAQPGHFTSKSTVNFKYVFQFSKFPSISKIFTNKRGHGAPRPP